MIIAASILTIIWLVYLIRGLHYAAAPTDQLIKEVYDRQLFAKQIRLYALGKQKVKKRNRHRNKKEREQSYKPPAKLLYLPGYVLYHDLKLEQQAPMLFHMIHSVYLQKHRYQWSNEATVFIVNEALSKAMLVVVAGSWLAYAANEAAISLIAVVLAIAFIYSIYQSAASDMKIRKRAILMELPKLLTQLTLLVGAGETVQQAFIKCIRSKLDSHHPLYMEWREAVSELSNGASFQYVIEKLNRNCALQQMSLLTTILLLNYRKGGEHFIAAVQELSLSLWETRKMTAKIKGEESSSKMIFPLVAILFLLMILIVAPAVMMMNFM